MGRLSLLSRRIAFCGMMTALGVVLMAFGGLIPVATYITPLMASVLLLSVMIEFGAKAAWTVWLATALVMLVIGADKEAAFLYLFIGYYPILKPRLDKIGPRFLRSVVKTFLFGAVLGAMYALLCFVFKLDAVLAEFRETTFILNALFFAVFVLTCLLYDRLLLRILPLYLFRLRPKFRFFTQKR